MTFSEAKQSVDTVVEAVRRGDENVSDETVADAIDAFNNAMAFRTNAESAAYHLMSVVAPVCFYRRHLADELMPVPIFALLGYGISHAEQVLGWMERHLSSNTPFDRMEPSVAAWLRASVVDGRDIAVWFARAQDWENELAEQ